MFVDRRGSREGKKTSLRQTDRAKKHVTTMQAGAGAPVPRTCVPANLLPISHSQPIFDAGCNLVNRQFENDFQRVVTRALKDGVAGMVMVPNDFDKVNSAITLCKWLPGVLYCAAGLHPSNIAKKISDKQFAQMVQQLREKLIVPEVVALLCGMDFARDTSLRIPQEKFLRAELKLAGELDLPIFVLSHTSQMSDEEGDEISTLLEIIKECREDFGEGLVHNFYGSAAQLKQFIDLDLHIAISGIITHEKHTPVSNLIPQIPRDKFLFCSDSPYHTPQNIVTLDISDSFVRESRNEPSNLPFVLQVCAKAYGITNKELAANVLENAQHFFNLNATQPVPEVESSSKSETTSKSEPTSKSSDKSDAKPSGKKGDSNKQEKKPSKKVDTDDHSDEEVPKRKQGKGKEKGGKGKRDDSEEEEGARKKGQQPPKMVEISSDEEEEVAKPKRGAQKKGKAKEVEEEEEDTPKGKKGQQIRKGKGKEESSEEETVTIPKKGQKKNKKDESSEEEVTTKSKKVQKKSKGKGKDESEEEDEISKPKKGQQKRKGKGKEESEEELDIPAKSKSDTQKSKPQETKNSKEPTKETKKAAPTKKLPKKEETTKAEKAEEQTIAKDKDVSKEIISEVKNININEEDSEGEDIFVEYACKMCRTKLFTSNDLQSHQTVQRLKDEVCRMYFLDKMDWMKGIGENGGRLVCPKCDQKLGRFDAAGISCSCGTTVTPAYKVAKSRVDAIGEASSSSSEQDLQFGESKKKTKKKRGGRKATKGNFSHFRNKDYSASKKQETDSDED